MAKKGCTGLCVPSIVVSGWSFALFGFGNPLSSIHLICLFLAALKNLCLTSKQRPLGFQKDIWSFVWFSELAPHKPGGGSPGFFFQMIPSPQWVDTHHATVLHTLQAFPAPPGCWDPLRSLCSVSPQKSLHSDFPGAETHMNTKPELTFLSFLQADILVTSESKFSHLAAMLSRNIKFAVDPFQYAVDCDDLWIQTDSKGKFDEAHFLSLWRWQQSTWQPQSPGYSHSVSP